MSKTHHTYREWGEYRKQRELTKDFKNWKLEAIKEIEVSEKDSLYSVYVIVNEWHPEGVDEDVTLQEIVGAKWLESDGSAWDHLNDIAETYGVDLHKDDLAFDVPASRLEGIDLDTYYIQELTR